MQTGGGSVHYGWGVERVGGYGIGSGVCNDGQVEG